MTAQQPELHSLTLIAGGGFLLDGEEISIETLGTRAGELHRNGNTQKASYLYEQLLQQEPRHLQSLHALGLIAFQNKNLSGAIDFLNKALDIAPDNASLYYDRALVFQSQNEFATAIKNYDLAIFLNNSFAPAHSNKGIALEAMGHKDLAIQCYELAICIDPSFASAWYNRGNICKALTAFEQAIFCYEVATTLNPNFWEAYTNLGLSWYALKMYQKALAAYDQALLIEPNQAVIHYNRANVYRTTQDFAKALAGYDCAVKLNPRFAPAYANRGLVRKDLNQLGEAAADYSLALGLDPALLEARWNLSIVDLTLGRWTPGWEGYELRFKHSELRDSVGAREFKEPRWSQDLNIAAKRILIYSEQGLGDAIQFSRYLLLLSRLGAQVIFEVQPALKRLFENLEGVTSLCIRGEVLPDFDYYLPLLSLPRAFQTQLETIPVPAQFKLDATVLERWRNVVNQCSYPITSAIQSYVNTPFNPTKKIGIVWRGNPNHTNDHNRSLNLASLLQHLPSKFLYFVLQKEISDDDSMLLGEHTNIINLSADLYDLTDTAALCSQLDLVICVDTSVAHLSASFNIPTYLLLPFSPDWRWLMQREDSPWYPSLRLLRQSSIGDWGSVLLKLNHLLNSDFK